MSPFDITLGQLVIPQQDLTTAEAMALQEQLNGELKFNPWNNATLKPIGGLNRARRTVYAASQAYRSGEITYTHVGWVRKALNMVHAHRNRHKKACPWQ